MKHIWLICFLFQTPLYAQINPGPRSISMGSAGMALQGVWSLQQNTAGIVGVERPVFAIGYEQHFWDPELSTQSALVVLPLQQHIIGLSFQRFGFSDFRQQTARLAYSRKFGNTLSLAIGFNYHQVVIINYGSGRTFSVDAGMQFQINEKILLGCHIANPGKSRFENHSGSHIPVSLSFGSSFLFSDKVMLISDIQKDLASSIDMKLGLEYKLIKWFSVRGGISLNPLKQYGGFGLNYQRYVIEAAVASHPILGISPNLAMSYEF